MHTDIPSCTRCCFCLPLRYGLIVWGYFKLTMASLLLLAMSFTVHTMVKALRNRDEIILRRFGTMDIIFISSIIIVCLADIILSVLFIVGCHLKNLKLMKTYYFYSVFLLGLTAPLCLYNFGVMLYYTYRHIDNFSVDLFLYTILDALMVFSNIAMQVYVLLLVRSEIRKLDSNYQFRFENLASQAECNLNIDSYGGSTATTITIKENKYGDNQEDVY